MTATGASAVLLAEKTRASPGAASLAEMLFNPSLAGRTTVVDVPAGQRVLCAECNSTVFEIVGGALVIRARHHGERHTTVLALSSLGLAMTPA